MAGEFKVAVRSAELIKESLAANPKLKELMLDGQDITSLITFHPTINMTKLNREYGAHSYISLSFNKIEPFEEADVHYLKVNVVLDQVNIENPMRDAMLISEEVIKEITTKELKFAYAEQYVFGDMEETYFDLDNQTWGYVIIFAVSSTPI